MLWAINNYFAVSNYPWHTKKKFPATKKELQQTIKSI